MGTEERHGPEKENSDKIVYSILDSTEQVSEEQIIRISEDKSFLHRSGEIAGIEETKDEHNPILKIAYGSKKFYSLQFLNQHVGHI